jgi:hypothetical protein
MTLGDFNVSAEQRVRGPKRKALRAPSPVKQMRASGFSPVIPNSAKLDFRMERRYEMKPISR